MKSISREGFFPALLILAFFKKLSWFSQFSKSFSKLFRYKENSSHSIEITPIFTRKM
jgi:hypothetical protein